MNNDDARIEEAAFRFIELWEQIEDIYVLNEQVSLLYRQMGFSWHIVDLLLRPPKNASAYIKNWPQDHLDAYLDLGYFEKDPAYLVMAHTIEPMSWKEAREAFSVQGAAQVFGLADDFAVHDGLVIPIHGEHGYKGFVSLATETDCADSPVVRAAAHMVAIYAHEAARRLLTGPLQFATGRLTPREREVLALAAAGKTNREIGMILSISPFTVHSHIENAKRRYEVNTRMQAVIEAIHDGDLQI